MFDARRFMTNRATFAAVSVVLALGLWRWMGGGAEVERVSVTGVVLAPEAPAPSSPGAAALQTVTVQLEDGRRVRLMVTGVVPAPGDAVHLWRSRTDQGAESYTLQGVATR